MPNLESGVPRQDKTPLEEDGYQLESGEGTQGAVSPFQLEVPRATWPPIPPGSSPRSELEKDSPNNRAPGLTTSIGFAVEWGLPKEPMGLKKDTHNPTDGYVSDAVEPPPQSSTRTVEEEEVADARLPEPFSPPPGALAEVHRSEAWMNSTRRRVRPSTKRGTKKPPPPTTR